MSLQIDILYVRIRERDYGTYKDKRIICKIAEIWDIRKERGIRRKRRDTEKVFSKIGKKEKYNTKICFRKNVMVWSEKQAGKKSAI